MIDGTMRIAENRRTARILGIIIGALYTIAIVGILLLN